MTWFGLIQLFMNLVCIGLIIWLWFERKTEAVEVESTQPSLSGESQKIQEELVIYKQQMVEQLRVLKLITEQAKRVLDGKQTVPNPFPPSEEELDLRNVYAQKPEAKIPTLLEIETAKQRLKAEGSIDLKTLLREQLA